MRKSLIVLAFMILGLAVNTEAQYIFKDPLENLYLDLYIERRAENLYKERLKKEKESLEENRHTNTDDLYEAEPEEAVHISIDAEQREMETIICYYDKSRQLQCDTYNSEESNDN